MRLLPRDQRFFERFTTLAELITEAARHLEPVLEAEGHRRDAVADNIKRLEREADEVTHDVVTRLDRTFITPLDREDIHLLASRLDDVIDRIDGIARRSQIFRLGPPPEGVRLIAQVIHRAATHLLEAVRVLGNGKARTVLTACRQIKQCEEEGDMLYHEWLGRLFEESHDPIYVMKWKEIYDTLEKALDNADDVANILESVAIKHA
jgi:uncharacterized protein